MDLSEQQEDRRQLRLQDIDMQPDTQHHEQLDQQLPTNVALLHIEEVAGSTSAETPTARGTANVRSRVRYWLNDIVDEMRKKSPASVQKWVDSIQIPNSAGCTSNTATDLTTSSHSNAPQQAGTGTSDVFRPDQLADVAVTTAIVEQVDEVNERRPRKASESSQEWTKTVEQIDGNQEEDEELEEDFGGNRVTKHVLREGSGIDSNVTIASTEALGGFGTTSTPKVTKMDDGSKLAAESSGLSLRNFLSKKSLLGKFNRSGSNLDHSPTATENAPAIGVPGRLAMDEADRKQPDDEVAPLLPPPSPFVMGKSKINEFYDKLSINKAKYNLIKAKKLDIRNMLGGVALGGRESSGATKSRDAQPHAAQSGAAESIPYPCNSERGEGETVDETLAEELEHHDRSSSSQPPEPLEVSVVDMDPSDAYEFSFDESFPKSDELIPGMISEEDEEKENILDSTVGSGADHHGYGYDAYLNPPKPKTHRIGIGRIGRSSSENPRATARRYNLMEIGRSFSEMNDDDDSFAISECNNSCPNPSSLNTSSSINDHGSSGNLTRSVPVSPIPRTSSKLNIQQEQLGQHPANAHIQQQHSLSEQSTHRRRSTMLVKDSSLQSDSSRCSSVESLLNARKPDPEKILLNLGFGPAPHSTDVLAKIPKRFLKPSQVRGVDTEAFLRQQQLSMHIHETSVLGYRGLVGNPHIPPSMIVAKIMERFQENDTKTRLTAAGIPLPQSDSRNSSGPPSPLPMTRHASLATTDGRLKF